MTRLVFHNRDLRNTLVADYASYHGLLLLFFFLFIKPECGVQQCRCFCKFFTKKRNSKHLSVFPFGVTFRRLQPSRFLIQSSLRRRAYHSRSLRDEQIQLHRLVVCFFFVVYNYSKSESTKLGDSCTRITRIPIYCT